MHTLSLHPSTEAPSLPNFPFSFILPENFEGKARKILRNYDILGELPLSIQNAQGDVHLNIGRPLTEDEIVQAADCDKNDRYQRIRHTVDKRIIDGYTLWKTNYIAYDIVYGCSKYSDRYSPADAESFKAYMAHQMERVEPELDRGGLRDIFLSIYSNPVVSKEKAGECI